MDTKWKNTEEISYFKGVISWVCSLLLLLVVCGTTVTALCFCLFGMVGADDLLDGFYVLAYEFAFMTDTHQLFVTVMVLCIVGLLALCIALTVLYRRQRKLFQHALGQRLGKIWMEFKLLGLLIAGALLFIALCGIAPYSPFIASSLFLSGMVFLLYLLCLDISVNRQFFRHNIIHSFLERINRYHDLNDYTKLALRRFFSCIAVMFLGPILGGLWFLYIFDRLGSLGQLLAMLALVPVFGAVGGLLWYIRTLKADMEDWNALTHQISEMYAGNLDAENHISPESCLAQPAVQLNALRTSMQTAIDEGIKSERTKVELITNVSHDIKTPLTSIIGYIDLLKKEPDLPAHVVDYINTASDKADRLSRIVKDVFDVSKATTGNLPMQQEELDLTRLLQQTFAEMEEVMQKSELTWRTELPEESVFVQADGACLYRVFQNLIVNCAQYSLEGSRAYIRLTADDAAATVRIRNISKVEFTGDAEDLTARFVRGDANRTTEGSGLGLSIAKSFTEACGGTFRVQIDGDLFTATVTLPRLAQPTRAEEPEPEAEEALADPNENEAVEQQ